MSKVLFMRRHVLVGGGAGLCGSLACPPATKSAAGRNKTLNTGPQSQHFNGLVLSALSRQGAGKCRVGGRVGGGSGCVAAFRMRALFVFNCASIAKGAGMGRHSFILLFCTPMQGS